MGCGEQRGRQTRKDWTAKPDVVTGRGGGHSAGSQEKGTGPFSFFSYTSIGAGAVKHLARGRDKRLSSSEDLQLQMTQFCSYHPQSGSQPSIPITGILHFLLPWGHQTYTWYIYICMYIHHTHIYVYI